MRAIRTLGGPAPRRWRRIGVGLVGLLVAGLVASCSFAMAKPAPAPAAGPLITITNFTFQGDLTVRPGVTVTVRNADRVMHTLTAVDGSFTTPTIQPGTSATFKAPTAIGRYDITCNFHPSMAGILTVTATPPTTTPSPTTTPRPTTSHGH